MVYNGTGVERLLDRSHIEDTKAGGDKSAESQFSFARVWENDQGTLRDEMAEENEEQQQRAPDPGVWANILRERERAAAGEAVAKADAYGRGRRARGNIDYGKEGVPEGTEGLDITPIKINKRQKEGDESDTDFRADASGRTSGCLRTHFG